MYIGYWTANKYFFITAPGDDTVCYSMFKNTPLATRHLFLSLINQSFTEGRQPTKWKMAKIIPITKKDKTSSHLTTPGFLESHGTIGAIPRLNGPPSQSTRTLYASEVESGRLTPSQH